MNHHKDTPMTPLDTPNPDTTPNSDTTAAAEAQRAKETQAFRIHAVVFAASMTLIIAVNLLTNLSAGTAGQWSSWWSLWALIGWGAGLTVHGLVVKLAHSVR